MEFCLQEGNTAIHLAAKFGHIGELDVYREFGLNLAHTSAKTGFNALHVASLYGQTDFAQEILHDVIIFFFHLIKTTNFDAAVILFMVTRDQEQDAR